MKAKMISVGGGIQGVADAFAVLDGVKGILGLKTSLDSSHSEQGEWWFGYNILRKGNARNTKQLESRITDKGKIVAWFGFQGSHGTPPKRAVWLYCSDRKRANRASKLVPFAEEPHKFEWSIGWDVEIKSELNRAPRDCEWFLKVFGKLGVKPIG